MYQTTYHRPSSVDEAAAAFAKGTEAKYLAGGHTLIPVMKQRLASPSDVIDLGKLKELIGIEASGEAQLRYCVSQSLLIDFSLSATIISSPTPIEFRYSCTAGGPPAASSSTSFAVPSLSEIE